MADIGLNQNLSIKKRKFHFQTATHIDEGIIKTEVFEKGRLLFSEYKTYERRDYGKEGGAELRIRRLLDKFHHSVISGLQTLFELSAMLADNNHDISHFRLGSIFLHLHLYDVAEKHLLKAIDIDPKLYCSYVMLVKCYFFQKRVQLGIQTIEPLVKEDVDYPDLYNILGLLMLEQKNFFQALNHFSHAIKLNPNYKEAYINLVSAILQRINFLRVQNKKEDVDKNLDFLNVILNKVSQIGNQEDKKFVAQLQQAINGHKYGKLQTLVQEYVNKMFYQKVPPENNGFEFYLWLRYLPERLDYDTLKYFEIKISKTLEENSHYPDMWNYVALIHLMLCRNYFLKGLDNFKEATQINPNFTKAKKNLRLVENDGREFLSLISAIVK